MIGSIVAVSDLNVKVLLDKADSVVVGDILEAIHNNRKYVFEIVEINENIANVYCCPFPVHYLIWPCCIL